MQGDRQSRFTRVGFLRDPVLQANGEVYESTLLFWLPWGLRKEMPQKTYPCKGVAGWLIPHQGYFQDIASWDCCEYTIVFVLIHPDAEPDREIFLARYDRGTAYPFPPT